MTIQLQTTLEAVVIDNDTEPFLYPATLAFDDTVPSCITLSLGHAASFGLSRGMLEHGTTHTARNAIIDIHPLPYDLGDLVVTFTYPLRQLKLLLPLAAVQSFLAETYAVVPVHDEAYRETAALERALHQLLVRHPTELG